MIFASIGIDGALATQAANQWPLAYWRVPPLVVFLLHNGVAGPSLPVLLFAVALVLPYAMFLLWLIRQNSLPASKASLEKASAQDVTVVIPVRNELHNLEGLLPRLAREARSCETLLRVVVVDDHSSDGTAGFVSSFLQPGLDVHYIRLEQETGKKVALRRGIEFGSTEYYITLDGDCLPETGWLSAILTALDAERPDLLILPIALTGGSLFQAMQGQEFGAIMAVTEGFSRAGLPIMCNGANLAFSRDLWLDFEARRHDHAIASGDDMFLLHFAQAEGYAVSQHFVRSAFVTTEAVPSWRGFVAQRLRWAGKWNHYRDWPTRITAVLVWGFHLAYAGLFWASVVMLRLEVLALLVIFKWMPEALLILQSLRKAGRPFNEPAFWSLQVVYSPYVVLTGFAAVFGKGYTWKGRTLEKSQSDALA